MKEIVQESPTFSAHLRQNLGITINGELPLKESALKESCALKEVNFPFARGPRRKGKGARG